MFYIIILGLFVGYIMDRVIVKFVNLKKEYRVIRGQSVLMCLMTMFLYLYVYVHPNPEVPLYMQFLIVSIYICIAMIDIKYMIIPDQMNVLLAMSSVFVAFLSVNISVMDSIAGFFAGAVIMTIIALLGPLGGGDIKCMAALGIGLGLSRTLYAIVLSFVIAGGISSILLILRVVKRTDKIPFGPFIFVGAFVANYFYSEIISLYTAFLF